MVDLELVARRAAERSFAYLITVTPHGGIHTSVVHPTVEAAAIRVTGVSDRVRRNAGAHPQVSLVWPPTDAEGHSLIVDGTAHVDAELKVAPARAVLHRPATGPQPSSDGSCVQDCIDL